MSPHRVTDTEAATIVEAARELRHAERELETHLNALIDVAADFRARLHKLATAVSVLYQPGRVEQDRL